MEVARLDHRLHGVEQQVPENLAEPLFGTLHHQDLGVEVSMDPNVVVLYQLPEKSQTLLQNLLQISYSCEQQWLGLGVLQKVRDGLIHALRRRREMLEQGLGAF